MGLQVDGTIWTWGDNSFGKIGDGTLTKVLYPKKIGSDNSWISINTKHEHSAAIKSSGELWVWGSYYYNCPATYIPKFIDNNYLNVSAGLDFTSSIKSNGTLWAWGTNQTGCVGNGSLNLVSLPVQISSGQKWILSSASLANQLAITSNGKSYCGVGNNDYGTFGNGNNISKYSLDCSNIIGSGGSTPNEDAIIIDENAEHLIDAIRIFPNPASGLINIEFSILKSEEIDIDIYNKLGMKVLSLSQLVQEPGLFEYKFNLIDKDLSSGLYILVIKFSGNSFSEKIFITN